MNRHSSANAWVHRLFIISCAISLLLCLATVASWMWTLNCIAEFTIPTSWRAEPSIYRLTEWRVNLGVGNLSVSRETATWTSQTIFGFPSEIPHVGKVKCRIVTFSAPIPRLWRNQFGAGRRESPASPLTTHSSYWVQTPLWCVALAFLVMPIFGLRSVIRSRLHRPGCCRTCGYSLTGNTSGVCPECGTPVPKAPADKSPRCA
jgi:hypothetical protein